MPQFHNAGLPYFGLEFNSGFAVNGISGSISDRPGHESSQSAIRLQDANGSK